MARCPRCGYQHAFPTLDSKKVQDIRREYPNAFSPWTKEQDARLTELVQKKEAVSVIAGDLGRQPSAILKRIQVLGLDIVKPEPEQAPNETSYLDGAAPRAGYRITPRR